MYYWGFWGTFGIDAFNYYPVTDLVKGITGSIISPLSFILSMFIFICAILLLTKIFEKWAWLNRVNNIRQFVISLIIMMPLLLIFIFSVHKINGNRINTTLNGVPEYSELGELLLALLAAVVSFGILFRKIVNHTGSIQSIMLPFVGVWLALALPGRVLSYGKATALRIKYNKEFNYIVTDSIEKHKFIYKLLGKTGDYYVLTTLNNSKNIIISVSKIDPIIIENYSLDNSASIKRFRMHIKLLLN
jgi:glucan phosphoethanolaminetransferase (alkaline phosphatase superfamily)